MGCRNSHLFVFQLDDTDDEDRPVCCSRTSCELNLTTSLIPRPQWKMAWYLLLTHAKQFSCIEQIINVLLDNLYSIDLEWVQEPECVWKIRVGLESEWAWNQNWSVSGTRIAWN